MVRNQRFASGRCLRLKAAEMVTIAQASKLVRQSVLFVVFVVVIIVG